MATAVSHSMSFNPFAASNSCDGDVDEYFNFNDFQQSPSTNNASTSSQMQSQSSAPSALTSPATTIAPLDTIDEYPAKPSHDYSQHKQLTGLPSNSIPGLQANNYSAFSNSGLDDMSFMTTFGTDTDFNMDMALSNDMPPFFYPNDNSQHDDFVDPSNITSQSDEPAQVRVYPGMHQQQALAKAQAQAQAQAQQRQQQMLQAKQQQQQQSQQTRGHASRRSASHSTDARTEETIARVVNQIRQNSQMASQHDLNQGDILPHIVRMKKDEEDMDEDERLLASEEGKKLSSKERRQLRNKVSARAFRSRRKEYIGQLEGEVAAKTNEANDLRLQNRALMEENARSRAFIENLLRHRAFAPFLDELSRDESIQQPRLPIPQQQQQQQAGPTPTPQPERKDVNPYQASQPFPDVTRAQNPQIGMALVPETPLDLSMLSIGNNWSSQGVAFPSYQQPQVFAVTEIPQGPANPLDTSALSGKGYEAFDDELEVEDASLDEVKPDFPVFQPASKSASPAASETHADRALDSDPAFALFHSSAPVSSSVSATLAPVDDATAALAMARVERICSSMAARLDRLS